MCAAGIAYMVTRPGFRQWVMRTLWRIPAVGERIRVYQLARFYRTLGMLLRGGIPIVTALEMVSGLLEQALRSQLALASDCIREGQPISYAMETYGLTTPVALRLLRVGEHTGGMGEMTERIANFLRRRDGALGGLVHPPVRTAADGVHRPGDRGHRDPDVFPYL